MTKIRAAWGDARVEMNALGSEILARLDDVSSAKRLYDELRDSGRLTISERSFYVHLSRLKRAAAMARPASSPASAAPPLTAGKTAPPRPTTEPTLDATAASATPTARRPRLAIEGPEEWTPQGLDRLWDGDNGDDS